MEKDNEYLKDQLLKMNEDTSLKTLQEYSNEMEDIRGFKNDVYKTMLYLTEELGELAKEVRKSEKLYLDEAKSKEVDIEGEVADVFMYLLSLCRIENINLLDAFKNKELKNCERVWK